MLWRGHTGRVHRPLKEGEKFVLVFCAAGISKKSMFPTLLRKRRNFGDGWRMFAARQFPGKFQICNFDEILAC